MAPENKDFIDEVIGIIDTEEESEKIEEIFGMGGRREGTGYKWMIEREFERSFLKVASEHIIPDSFLKRITGGPGYKVASRYGLELGIGSVMQNNMEVKSQPIQKEFFEIMDTSLKGDSMVLVQMVSIEKEGLEKIFDSKLEKLISEYPQYFEIQDLSEYGECDTDVKFSFLMNMPQKEQNSFLKEGDSIYYFLISSEINRKSHPALRAVLATLIDLRERKELLRKKEIREAVKSVLQRVSDSDLE